ncbi:MAG: hypothetical protein Q7S83_02640 [bacterium]|nr:hypothetical protein [bacterium]
MKDVLTIILQLQFECAGRFLYFLSESEDEDGTLVACLEVGEVGAGGKWCKEMYFTGFGHDARLLKAFYNQFLPARDGDHLKVAAMLRAGICDPEDIYAGLQIQDADALMTAIEAAQKHGFGLHLFVHLKD